MTAFRSITAVQWDQALEEDAPLLALVTGGLDSAQRLDELCEATVAHGRCPVVLTLGHLSPRRQPNAEAYQCHLAAGTVLDEHGLVRWWEQSWWSTIAPNFPVTPTTTLLTSDTPSDRNLVQLGHLLALHVVWLRQRTGHAFGSRRLSELARLDNLMGIAQPETRGLDDPLSQRVLADTLRYAQSLGLSPQEVVQRGQDWPDHAQEQHGYNHMRLTKTLGTVHRPLDSLLGSSLRTPGWNAAGWFERGEVLLMGLAEAGPGERWPMARTVEHDDLRHLFRWITADVARGLPARLHQQPVLNVLNEDADTTVGLDWLAPWAERQALLNALPDEGPRPGRRANPRL